MQTLRITQKDNKCKIIIDGHELDGVLWFRLERKASDEFAVLELRTEITDEVQVELL